MGRSEGFSYIYSFSRAFTSKISHAQVPYSATLQCYTAVITRPKTHDSLEYKLISHSYISPGQDTCFREPLLYAVAWKMRLAEALLSSTWTFQGRGGIGGLLSNRKLKRTPSRHNCSFKPLCSVVASLTSPRVAVWNLIS